MRKIKALRWPRWSFASQAMNLTSTPIYQPASILNLKRGLKMNTLSMHYAFDAEDQKADLSWVPTTIVVYSAVVACSLALVAALAATGAGNVAELMGVAVALAAP